MPVELCLSVSIGPSMYHVYLMREDIHHRGFASGSQYAFTWGGRGGEGRRWGAESAAPWKDAKSMYEFSAKDIDGNEVSLEKYKCGLFKNIFHNP
ncbi:unnamed protein product [Lampetra fluviatilis]